MYTYSAGSPGTFSGPRPIDLVGPGYGTYLQEGRPLSYAPRFGGMGTSELYAAGSPGTFRHYGAEAGEASGQATGGGWADVINAAISGVATIWQMDTQRRLNKQQQHQVEREAARQAELAKTQAMYLASQSIKPAQGSHVTVPAGAFPPGRARIAGVGIGTIALLGAAGVGAWWFLGRRKRRR